MLDTINTVRAEHGLPPLSPNEQLAAAAQGHAEDMSTHPGMIHIGSDGSDGGQRIHAAGYQWRQWGEVTGWGFDGDNDRMVDWWLNSPDHRHYLLSDQFTDVGIGYETGGVWGHYWTVDFGRDGATVPAVPPNPPAVPPEAPPPPYHSYVPVTAAPGLDFVDLLPYLCGDGRMYEVRHSSGATETLQTQTEGLDWYQVKNSAWEQLYADESFIWRGLDTSPGGGRFYRQFENGMRGARWCPRHMTVGQSWSGPGHWVQFYNKDTCEPDAANSGAATNRMRLAARRAAMTWNGITVPDVVEMTNGTETYFYAKGYGLVAWASAWGESAIAQVYAAGERPPLVREKIRCL